MAAGVCSYLTALPSVVCLHVRVFCPQDVEALLSGTADTVRDVWAPEANLDDFFSRMYRYYHDKGFPSILASHITSLITLAFTVSFSTFLLVFVDWGHLLTCGDGHANAQKCQVRACARANRVAVAVCSAVDTWGRAWTST